MNEKMKTLHLEDWTYISLAVITAKYQAINPESKDYWEQLHKKVRNIIKEINKQDEQAE